MALMIDVILVVILALCTYFGWKRGFVKTLSGFISYVISFAIANATHRFLASYVIKLPFLQKMISDVEMPVFSEDATFLDKSREILAYVKTAFSEGDAAKEQFELVLGNYVAEFLSTVLSFILIFTVVVIILKLLIWMIDTFVKKFPVIKHANGLLGGVTGLLNGFIWTWAISNLVVRFLLPALHAVWPDIFIYEIADSVIIDLCIKINPITYLFEFINMIS